MRAIRLLIIIILALDLIGCDAFVRKFTRKPKKDQYQKEELVLAPEEYKPSLDKEGQYRQYLLFWKSWQDELITSLLSIPGLNPNHKKQVSCADEAIKNLMGMRALLNAKGQKLLDVYLGQMTELRDGIDQDVYSLNINMYRNKAERIRRDILQYFSFGDIKKELI